MNQQEENTLEDSRHMGCSTRNRPISSNNWEEEDDDSSFILLVRMLYFKQQIDRRETAEMHLGTGKGY